MKKMFSVGSSCDPAKINFSPNRVLLRAHLQSMKGNDQENFHRKSISLPSILIDAMTIFVCID